MQIKGIQNLGFGNIHVRYDERKLSEKKLEALGELECKYDKSLVAHYRDIDTSKRYMTFKDTPKNEKSIMKQFKELDVKARRSTTPGKSREIEKKDYDWAITY